MIVGPLAVFLLLLAGASADPLPAMSPHDCTAGTIEMDVRAATVSIPGVVEFQTRAYHFNGGGPVVPGDIIKMKAGTACTVRVTNSLVGVACAGAESFELHCPDTTNLHTHGLHVSPYEDNIDTTIEPNGGSHTYVYNLPEEHLMGTHWYHAHHHGSTSLQVMGGLAGVLLVEPADNYTLPGDLQALYEDPTVPPILMTHIKLDGPDDSHPVFDFLDQQGLTDAYDVVNVPLNVNWLDDSVSGRDFYVVNGLFNPSVTIKAGVATLLRLIHAGGFKLLTLALSNPSACSLTLLARDGVFQYTPYLTLSAISFMSGTRADVAILCEESAVGQTINLQASPDAFLGVSDKTRHVQDSMLQIIVESRGSAAARAVPTSQAPLPAHFDSLLDATDVKIGGERGSTAIEMNAYGGSAQAKTELMNINHNRFARNWDRPDSGQVCQQQDSGNCNEKYVEEFCLDRVYELQLGFRGPDSTVHTPDGPSLFNHPPHPYHQHINHFQIVDGRDPSGQVVRDGEWRDVAPGWSRPENYLTMRFKPVRFAGDVVLHCHFLQHEDKGMMGLYKIHDCDANTTDTTATPDTIVVSGAPWKSLAPCVLGLIAACLM